MNWAEEEHENL